MAICIILHVTGHTDRESVIYTIESLKSQQQREDITKDTLHIALWYTGDTGFDLKTIVQQEINLNIELIQSDVSFFNDLNKALKYIDTLHSITSILHCTAGIGFKPPFLSFISQKRDEYKEVKEEDEHSHSILTSHGIRLFPHYKTNLPLQNGVHYKYYNESVSDRAVHIFTPHLCLIDKRVFCKLASLWQNDLSFKWESNTHMGHFWYSYTISTQLDTCIWKIDTSDVIDTGHLLTDYTPNCTTLPIDNGMKEEESFKVFYDFIYSHNWPRGISSPLYHSNHSNRTSPLYHTLSINNSKDSISASNNGRTKDNSTINDGSNNSKGSIAKDRASNHSSSKDSTSDTNSESKSYDGSKVSTHNDSSINHSNDTSNVTTPLDIWEHGFGGINMSSEPASELDFSSITSFYGVKVIRIGAVAGAQDLNYLINSTAKTTQEDYQHLSHVLPRLRAAIVKISTYGLKVIVTATDLPGASFQSGSSLEFWQCEVTRVRCAKFWGNLAKHLSDLSKVIIGYDLINEPHSPDDKDYLEEVTTKYSVQLHHFYNEAIKEIRTHDTKVKIILSPLGYSSPVQMEILTPSLLLSNDPHIVYSFHMYALPHLTLRTFRNKLAPPLSYPGTLRKWVNCPYDLIDLNYDFIRQILTKVRVWQLKYGIASHRILVGEFGISREVLGSLEYLRDLVEIFKEFGWSWLLFSYRDEEWDSMDYELGTDFGNMLYRSPTELFMTVAGHFH